MAEAEQPAADVATPEQVEATEAAAEAPAEAATEEGATAETEAATDEEK